MAPAPFMLLVLVAVHASLNLIQPILSGNKNIDLGVVFIAGNLVHSMVRGTADVINDVYGLKAARMNSWVTVIVRVVAWLVIGLIMALPGEVLNPGFPKVVQMGFRMFLAGVVAQILADLIIDTYVFDWIRRRFGHGFWIRYNLSNFVSGLVGPLVVLLVGRWMPGKPIWELYIGGITTKMVLGVALTPLYSLLAAAVKRYEARKAIP